MDGVISSHCQCIDNSAMQKMLRCSHTDADLVVEEKVQRDIAFAKKSEIHMYLQILPIHPLAKSLRPCSSSSCRFSHEQPSHGPRAGHYDADEVFPVTVHYICTYIHTRVPIHSIQLMMTQPLLNSPSQKLLLSATLILRCTYRATEIICPESPGLVEHPPR